VERLIGIVERMLDFYRPSPEQRELTDINAIMEEVLALAGKKLQHSKVSTQTKLAANLPPIKAVASQIQQVFLNLILNAIEAMPDGGQLTITTELSSDHRETLIAFADSGHGIPEEEISKVFEPFYTTKLKGTGLGLAISYGIVERHGGRIEVISEVGQGSTFTVRLPMERRI
jgi:two-component system NtrC family sensor kinase